MNIRDMWEKAACKAQWDQGLSTGWELLLSVPAAVMSVSAGGVKYSDPREVVEPFEYRRVEVFVYDVHERVTDEYLPPALARWHQGPYQKNRVLGYMDWEQVQSIYEGLRAAMPGGDRTDVLGGGDKPGAKERRRPLSVGFGNLEISTRPRTSGGGADTRVAYARSSAVSATRVRTV